MPESPTMTARVPRTAGAPTRSSIGDSGRWWELVVVLIGTFMILLDSTIVNVAIPSIQATLQASYESIEWVVSGYALAYGLFLIPAGRLGDRFGHKRLFLIGLAGFTITSALCGLSQGQDSLVFWRIVQGAMAGIMNPQIMAVIQIAFPPRERGRAFGIYGAVIGIATAAGPLVGGLLIAANIRGLEWEPIFLINIPIGIVAFIMAVRTLKESHGRAGSLDFVGIALVSAAVLLLTVPLIEGRALDWPAWTIISMIATLPVLAVFAWWELRRVHTGKTPLVDVRLFRNRAFTSGMGIALAYFGGFVGVFFVASLLIQNGLGHSALYSGLTVMPFSLGSLVSASQSDKVARRLGRNCLTLGTALVIVGICGLIVTIRATGSSLAGWQLSPWFLIEGVGSGLIIAPNVSLVLAGVPHQDAGSASGVLSATQRLGNAIGICLVGIILFGALQTGASSAAHGVTDDLRSELAAAGMPTSQVDASVTLFTECFERRANSSDPTAVPEGCPQPDPHAADPISTAFERAAATALGENFSIGAQRALLCSLALVVITFFLIFLLPRRVSASEMHAPSE